MLKLFSLYKHILLFILLSILGYFVNAQRTDFRIHEYNKQNKLREELVKSASQDLNGIYYLATDGGVFSLINDEFNLFKLPEGKSRYFKELFRMHNGSLLAVSDDAIYKINPSFEKNEIELLIECNKDPAAPKYPKHVYQDGKNRVWISDYNHIFRLNGKVLEKYVMDEKNLTSSYARSFQFLECDNGNLIVVSQKGWFYKFKNKSNSFEECAFKQDFLVHSSFKIGANEFLLGTSVGIIKIIFDFNGRVVHNEMISEGVIASCFERLSDNRILAGTWYQGLVEIELGDKNRIYPVGGFPYFTINEIFKDNFGKFWVSTNSGAIVMEQKFFFSQFLTANSEYVACIRKNINGELISASRNHLYKSENEYSLTEQNISFKGSLNVFQTFKKYTFIGTEQGNLLVYWADKLIKTIPLSQQSISDIEVVSLTEIWLVADKELFKLDLNKVKLESYFNQFKNRRIVQDICLTKNNTLFVGCEYKHSYLYKYSRENDKFQNISDESPFENEGDFWVRDVEPVGDSLFIGCSLGLFKYHDSVAEKVDLGDLSNGEIRAVAVDQYNTLWLTSSKGVIRKRNKDISLFTPDQGLPSKTFTVGNLLVDNNGHLWVGTSNGLAFARIKDSIPVTPKPLVHVAKDESHFIYRDTQLEVTTGSMLLMDVTATIYPQKQNEFQYCIIRGIQKIRDWKNLSSKNQVIVSDLEPGNYKICIRCKHEGNFLWSDHSVIPLKVNQVWYLRWYTLLSEAIIILFLIFLTNIYSKKRAKKQMLKLEKLVSQRTVQLQNANENLLSANKAKDKFLSIIGHDLRNPFNAIRGFSKMLIHDTDMLSEEEQKELLETIYKSSDDTFKLLESLLEWANVQKGNFKINKEEFDLALVIQSNLDLHKSLASLKEIKVIGKVEKVLVDADKAMVDTIIRNLLSNAIKYSFNGQTIELIVVKDNDFARIEVKDTGMGMTKAQVDKLFKIDSVFTSEGTANETGTGFGLMLSKEFVELNGGEIYVKSEKNKGTSFFFSIPLSKK
nr:ATP-binding protein [uncultured Marinifilum sp.]